MSRTILQKIEIFENLQKLQKLKLGPSLNKNSVSATVLPKSGPSSALIEVAKIEYLLYVKIMPVLQKCVGGGSEAYFMRKGPIFAVRR